MSKPLFLSQTSREPDVLGYLYECKCFSEIVNLVNLMMASSYPLRNARFSAQAAGRTPFP
jgi:hypothetical protein